MESRNHYEPVSSISYTVPEPPSPDIWKRRQDINKYPHTKYLKINGDTEKSPVENENAIEVTNTQEETNAPKREEWGKVKDFMLSCIGVQVGRHHFWRFPYLCAKHNGGKCSFKFVSKMFKIFTVCPLLWKLTGCPL